MFALIIVLLCIVIPVILAVMIGYWYWAQKNMPRIKYKDFRRWYNMNPRLFTAYECSVLCNLKVMNKEYTFGFIDYWRYWLWYKKNEIAENKKWRQAHANRLAEAINKSMEAKNVSE